MLILANWMNWWNYTLCKTLPRLSNLLASSCTKIEKIMVHIFTGQSFANCSAFCSAFSYCTNENTVGESILTWLSRKHQPESNGIRSWCFKMIFHSYSTKCYKILQRCITTTCPVTHKSNETFRDLFFFVFFFKWILNSSESIIMGGFWLFSIWNIFCVI